MDKKVNEMYDELQEIEDKIETQIDLLGLIANMVYTIKDL